jgi:hypothetical protein
VLSFSGPQCVASSIKLSFSQERCKEKGVAFLFTVSFSFAASSPFLSVDLGARAHAALHYFGLHSPPHLLLLQWPFTPSAPL